MAYKKYIKKDGKLYGPYIYESKRIGGKVVSEYHGHKNKINLKRFLWIFASIILISGLTYFLSTFNFIGLTGKAVLNQELNYSENQPIRGNLNLLLKQGELIPYSSKLIIENSGQSYEYDLNELISNKPAEGDFYVDTTDIFGTGLGYGIKGEKKIYPEITFVLEIYPATNETKNILETNEATAPKNEIFENESVSEIPDTNESISSEPTTAEIPETSENEEISEDAEQSAETSPITGFFARIYNFFLGLTPTGKAIAEETNEVTGKASFGNPFVYDIFGGEGVRLKPGSISYFDLVLPDENVQVRVEENKIIAESLYSETKKGFGKEYIGEKNEILSINLSALGLILNNGELIMKIVYGDKEIISSSAILEPGTKKLTSENTSDSTLVNFTIEQNVSEISKNITTRTFDFSENAYKIITADTARFILTEEEKALLLSEFGEGVVKTTRSEIFNNRLIIKYEIGNRWIEYSYEPNLPSDELEYQISLDRMKWLKDLAQQLKNKKIKNQQPNSIENFSI